jgi:CRP-like cAMP-binding protein
MGSKFKSPLLQLIDKVSFFDEFTESEKCEIVKNNSMVKKYEKKDTTIFMEGDEGRSVVIILAGQVNITKSSTPKTEEGRVSLVDPKTVTLATLGVGSVFGEVSLLSNKRRTSGVVTTTPLVIALQIDKEDLQTFNPSIQNKFQTQFTSILIKRLEEMNEKYGRSQI